MFTHAELLKQTPNLKKFAYKLTRNRDDADDLLQATITTALEKQNQFEHGTNLFSWTSKIMFNSFVSSYRHNSRFETQYDPQWYIDQEYVDAPQESEAELSQVFDAMLALSDDHRQILTMICVDGMRYEEVAQALKIPVGTVRSRLSRAREGLQEKLSSGQRRKPYLVPASVTAVTIAAATIAAPTIAASIATPNATTAREKAARFSDSKSGYAFVA
jgi:RNA polymerase sigma-70 factor, ECF subfamily